MTGVQTCALPICLKVEAVQGKQFSLEWTETFGGLWEWWHDPGVPLAFPVESASSLDVTEHWEFNPEHSGEGSLVSS